MRVIKWLIVLLLVAVVAALVFNYQSFGSEKSSKDVAYCTKCHEELPYYYTWMVTSHNKFGCYTCHEDVKITTMLYKHLRGPEFYKFPLERRRIVPDSVCLGCHAIDIRNVSPPGDIIFPHQLHVVKQIDCVDCHRNVVHLNISDEIKKTKDFNIDTFKDAEAKKLTTKYRWGTAIPMDLCMRCHNGDMATNKCEDCHKTIKTPKQ